ncbi:unnamed protein product, partial [Medioppia subpectinata]
ASTTLTCVNLFVLPYNYPILLPLLEDLFKVQSGKPTREWKVQFDNYLKIMPLYYASPLKRALQRMGAPNLVPDNMENCLSYPVLNYLKRLKNLAKAEYEKLVASVGTIKPPAMLQSEGNRVVNSSPNMRKMSELGLCSNPLLSKRFVSLKNELNEFPGFVIRFRDKYANDSKTHCYRNAFDINRTELLDQIMRMRTNFMQRHTTAIRYQDEDQLHSLPIAQMGNYQEYLKRMPVPLRELESTPVRQHMFGNPFKVDKRGMMMIDETDIDLVGSGGGGGGGSSPARSPKRTATDIYLNGPKPKRKPGPLPKDFPMRPLSPIPSPPPSPTPMTAIQLQSFPSTPPPSPLPTHTPSASPSLPPPMQTSVVKGVANGSAVLGRPKDHLTLNPLTTSTTVNSEMNQKSVIVTPKSSATETTNSSPIASTPHPNSSAAQSLPLNSIQNNSSTIDLDIHNSINLKTNPPLVVPVNGRLSGAQPSPSSPPPSANELTNHSEHNGTDNRANSLAAKKVQLTPEEFELKRYLFKLVRRPGRNFDELLRELSHIRLSLRDQLLQEVIAEANRFKRRSLIELLCNTFKRSPHDMLSACGVESV